MMAASSGWAQTDVTSKYIQNADFSQGTPIDNHLCGYGKDMKDHGTTYYGMQEVQGWKITILSGDDSNASYPNSGMGGAVFAYGSEFLLKGNNVSAPSAGPAGESGNALGFFAVWGCGAYYYQEATLPAGKYTITVPIYAASGTQANTSYIGFIPNSGSSYTIACNPAVGEWTTGTVEFTLTEETTGKVALGYKSTGSGSAANPMLFIDGVKIEYIAQVVKDALEEALVSAKVYQDVLNSDALNTAVATAQAVCDNSSATQEEINAQVALLKAALADAVAAVAAANDGVATAAIINNGFELSEAFEGNAAASGNAAGIDYADTGWKLIGYSAWSNSAVFAYGSESQINGAAVPAADMNGNSGKALGVSVGWGGQNYYQSTHAIVLPAGRYTLSAEAYNALEGVTQLTSKLAFVAADGTTYASTKSAYKSGEWEIDKVTFTLNEATEGHFQVGGAAISGGSGNNAKVFFDNLTLTYIDPVAGSKANYLDAVTAAIEALLNEDYVNVTGDEKKNLEAELAKSEPTTAEGYDEATAAINEATKAFIAAVPAYNALAAANAAIVDLPYALASKKPTAAQASNADEASKAASEVYVALRAYYESNAKAEAVEGAEDKSEAIVNRDATDVNNGWTIEGNMNEPRNTESWTDADGKNDYMYFDGGNWGANAWTTTMAQTITIPDGRYLLTAKGRAAVNTSLVLSVGENSVELSHVGSAGNVFDRGWNDGSVEFIVKTAADEETTAGTEILVTASTETVHEWFSVADFRLVRLGDADATAISEVNATAVGKDIYNLRGQRMEKAVKGIYIAGGKKLLVK